MPGRPQPEPAPGRLSGTVPMPVTAVGLVTVMVTVRAVSGLQPPACRGRNRDGCRGGAAALSS